jgi:tetratricopeptide (TPR) repeat protein
MSFFSKLIAPYRKGERNFERARAAEFRKDAKAAKNYFRIGAEAFDEHIAKKEAQGKEVRPSHLVMAGICYTRIGRFEDALLVLDQCIQNKDIPDAFLHAGYAAAQLGFVDKTINYWGNYPSWADQRIIATALKEQIKIVRSQKESALQTACESVTQAIIKQDIDNSRSKQFSPYNPTPHPKRRY